MPLLNAPLSVSGAKILDTAGKPVRLAGVNWGGAQQDGCVPAGLDRLHRDEIAARIAAMGFNHVRLPFAVGAFMDSSGRLRTGTADPARLTANPDLQGRSGWQVYKACVSALTETGLAVIPCQMLHWPGWCCSEADCNGLWYNGNWPASTFTACWVLIAEAFAGNDLVIGYDLHNEPRPATVNGTRLTPTWGDGNTRTDMRACYAATIAALRAAGPRKLWFCEGLAYASDVSRAGSHPVGVPGVVYSLHDYSWFHPAGQTLAAYTGQMDAAGGYLQSGDHAPLYIGETGTGTDVATASLGTGWFANFLAWAAAAGVHWAWWQLNATAVKGTEPVTNVLKTAEGQRETYGLLSGQDWQGTQAQVLALLEPLMS